MILLYFFEKTDARLTYQDIVSTKLGGVMLFI
jgi:hypothetical protein